MPRRAAKVHRLKPVEPDEEEVDAIQRLGSMLLYGARDGEVQAAALITVEPGKKYPQLYCAPFDLGVDLPKIIAGLDALRAELVEELREEIAESE